MHWFLSDIAVEFDDPEEAVLQKSFRQAAMRCVTVGS